jgi:hypothetical protein
MTAARAPVKTSPVFVRLPTPLTNAFAKIPSDPQETWSIARDWAAFARELERDAMTMALRLACQDSNTFGPEVAECMERWQPRVDALLANPETYK